MPCNPGSWTNVWDAPTFGASYLWADRTVIVRWRRFSSGIPWFMEGTANLRPGQNTVVHGGPSLYLRLEVNPTTFANIRST